MTDNATPMSKASDRLLQAGRHAMSTMYVFKNDRSKCNWKGCRRKHTNGEHCDKHQKQVKQFSDNLSKMLAETDQLLKSLKQ